MQFVQGQRAIVLQNVKNDINGAISESSRSCYPRGIALDILFLKPWDCLNWVK